jgi:radical SAM protein with 4Fe4S-binding SPASM domain
MELVPFPTRIHLESTNACNLDCVFCPYGRQTRRKGFMDPGLFRQIVDECAPHDPKIWLHFLGEPLLHKRLPELIAYGKARGLTQLGLSTNAFFLTSAVAEGLIRSGLDRLECSVDGLDAETFQRLRRSNEFPRVVQNVRQFLEVRHRLGMATPVVTLAFMKTPQNVRDLPAIREMWVPWLGARDFLMMIDDLSFAGEMRVAEGASARAPCRWLWNYAVILWNGDVVTCASDYDGSRVMGNVREQSLAAIWRGGVYDALRRVHAEGRWAQGGLCTGCDDWRLADGHGYQNVLVETPSRPSPADP